jgi:glycosyltransferase involved in cell wall biosynthesis
VAAIRHHQPGVDIIVVDDGSTDATAKHATAAGAVVLVLPINLGIGGAVQTGFRYAHLHGYDRALQFDGDGQHPADAIQRLLDVIDSGAADAVIGSRFLEGQGFQSTWIRRVGIVGFQWLSRLITGERFSDCTSGFRAYNAPAIAFLADTYPSDYPEVESIVILKRNGFRITEVPVTMHERQGGRSSITLVRSIYYMIKVSLASLISNIKPVQRGSA